MGIRRLFLSGLWKVKWIFFKIEIPDEFFILLGGGYYTLRDIIFFLQNESADVHEYRIKADAAGVTAVVVQDVTPLRDYLTGKTDNCLQIDHSALSLLSTDALNSQILINRVPEENSSNNIDAR